MLDGGGSNDFGISAWSLNPTSPAIGCFGLLALEIRSPDNKRYVAVETVGALSLLRYGSSSERHR